MKQTIINLLFKPWFWYIFIAVSILGSMTYAASVTNYRAVLVKDLQDFKQQEQQQKSIWDGTGRIITEKAIKIQELTQKMIPIDNKIKEAQREIDALKVTQAGATAGAADLRMKIQLTEEHLRDYDASQGFQREKQQAQ